MATVTFATFATVDEAHLLASRLRSAGIAAEVRDENMLANYSLAIGGAKVAVAESDVEDALAILEAAPEGEPPAPPAAE